MAVTANETPGTPGLDVIVREVERLNFGWTEDAQYDLTRLSVDRRVQVRETAHYAPKDAVERFAVMMGQSKFPPIVVTRDGWIVDGNTRVGGTLLREQKFFPAVVIDVDYAGKTTTKKTQNELHALAATFNAMNGSPLTSKEIRAVAIRFIELKWKTDQISRAIGVSAGGVTAVKKEIEAQTKLTRVGLDANGSLKGASLRALGSPQALALNDVPYRSLAELAADAGLNAGEISTAAKEAKKTGSDAEQAQVLDGLRTEMADRIRTRELTGVGKPPMARQLRQHLGFVTKFEDREEDLLEKDPEVLTKHVETCQTVIKILTRVVELQQS